MAEETDMQVTLEDRDDLGELEATRYKTAVCMKDRLFRMQILDEDGLICNMTMPPEEAYVMAQEILRKYDILEGLT